MDKKMNPDIDSENAIEPTQSHIGEVLDKTIQEDAVFGAIQEGDTNYRDVSNCLPDTSIDTNLIQFR